jgi:hypothetical protein
LAGADCGFVRQLGDVSERKSIARFDRLFPGCAFTGKAGVIGNGSASAAQQVITENDSCISFGKGGRYCSPTQ